jgi:hypothetical protein
MRLVHTLISYFLHNDFNIIFHFRLNFQSDFFFNWGLQIKVLETETFLMSPRILMPHHTVLSACNTLMIFVEQEKVSNGAVCVVLHVVSKFIFWILLYVQDRLDEIVKVLSVTPTQCLVIIRFLVNSSGYAVWFRISPSSPLIISKVKL